MAGAAAGRAGGRRDERSWAVRGWSSRGGGVGSEASEQPQPPPRGSRAAVPPSLPFPRCPGAAAPQVCDRYLAPGYRRGRGGSGRHPSGMALGGAAVGA